MIRFKNLAMYEEFKMDGIVYVKVGVNMCAFSRFSPATEHFFVRPDEYVERV